MPGTKLYTWGAQLSALVEREKIIFRSDNGTSFKHSLYTKRHLSVLRSTHGPPWPHKRTRPTGCSNKCIIGIPQGTEGGSPRLRSETVNACDMQMSPYSRREQWAGFKRCGVQVVLYADRLWWTPQHCASLAGKKPSENSNESESLWIAARFQPELMRADHGKPSLKLLSLDPVRPNGMCTTGGCQCSEDWPFGWTFFEREDVYCSRICCIDQLLTLLLWRREPMQ